MPNISGALKSYRYLLRYRYKFSISSNKKKYDISLTFKESDFFHLVGFHYLSDIDIPKSHTQLFSKIDNGKICDNTLAKSIYYCKVDESYANVKERIEGVRCLREYIESDNMVFKYIKNRNMYSSIRADFMLKSTVNQKTAFLFLRQRTNDDAYCICSFFVNPQNEYYGARAYWLYKSRIFLENGEETVLYNRFLEEKSSRLVKKQ